MIVYTHVHSVHRVIRDYAKVHFAIIYLRYLSSQFAGMVIYGYTIVAIVLIFPCMTFFIVNIGFKTRTDTQPGNSDSCITFVQTILPIALARPYVEQYVPEGTRVRLSLYIISIFITVRRVLKHMLIYIPWDCYHGNL